jgi:hypothetical protein
MVRDQALAASGLLVPGVGGPSVRPYMPEGVWDETSVYGDLRNYKADAGPGRYRRTMYTVWKRTAAPPTMLLFDAPNREVCTVRRSRTNTPLQALALLNDPTFVEAARKLAERVLREAKPEDGQRLAHAFKLSTARTPGRGEIGILKDLLRAQRQTFAGDRQAARKLLSVGESPRDEALDVAELAAWTMVSSTILNLDETITKQ